jgi:tight adherence protein B
MRLVIAVTLVFTLGVLLVGHGYFKPFGTPIGQIVLLAVAGLFAAGFAAMNRLSRPQPMPRLFDTAAENTAPFDSRTAAGAAALRAGRA